MGFGVERGQHQDAAVANLPSGFWAANVHGSDRGSEPYSGNGIQMVLVGQGLVCEGRACCFAH